MTSQVIQQILTPQTQACTLQTAQSEPWWTNRKIEILIGAAFSAAGVGLIFAVSSVLWPIAAAVLAVGLIAFAHGIFLNPDAAPSDPIRIGHEIQPLVEVSEEHAQLKELSEKNLAERKVPWSLDFVDEIFREQFSRVPYDPKATPFLEASVYKILHDAATLDEKSFKKHFNTFERKYPNSVPALAQGVLSIVEKIPGTIDQVGRSKLNKIRWRAQRYLPRGMPVRTFVPSSPATLPEAVSTQKSAVKTELSTADKVLAVSNAVQWGLIGAAYYGVGAAVTAPIAMAATVGSTIATYCMLPEHVPIVRKAMTLAMPVVTQKVLDIHPVIRGISQIHSLYTQARNAAPKLKAAWEKLSTDPSNAVKTGAVHLFNLASGLAFAAESAGLIRLRPIAKQEEGIKSSELARETSVKGSTVAKESASGIPGTCDAGNAFHSKSKEAQNQPHFGISNTCSSTASQSKSQNVSRNPFVGEGICDPSEEPLQMGFFPWTHQAKRGSPGMLAARIAFQESSFEGPSTNGDLNRIQSTGFPTHKGKGSSSGIFDASTRSYRGGELKEKNPFALYERCFVAPKEATDTLTQMHMKDGVLEIGDSTDHSPKCTSSRQMFNISMNHSVSNSAPAAVPQLQSPNMRKNPFEIFHSTQQVEPRVRQLLSAKRVNGTQPLDAGGMPHSLYGTIPVPRKPMNSTQLMTEFDRNGMTYLLDGTTPVPRKPMNDTQSSTDFDPNGTTYLLDGTTPVPRKPMNGTQPLADFDPNGTTYLLDGTTPVPRKPMNDTQSWTEFDPNGTTYLLGRTTPIQRKPMNDTQSWTEFDPNGTTYLLDGTTPVPRKPMNDTQPLTDFDPNGMTYLLDGTTPVPTKPINGTQPLTDFDSNGMTYLLDGTTPVPTEQSKVKEGPNQGPSSGIGSWVTNWWSSSNKAQLTKDALLQMTDEERLAAWDSCIAKNPKECSISDYFPGNFEEEFSRAPTHTSAQLTELPPSDTSLGSLKNDDGICLPEENNEFLLQIARAKRRSSNFRMPPNWKKMGSDLRTIGNALRNEVRNGVIRFAHRNVEEAVKLGKRAIQLGEGAVDLSKRYVQHQQAELERKTEENKIWASANPAIELLFQKAKQETGRIVSEIAESVVDEVSTIGQGAKALIQELGEELSHARDDLTRLASQGYNRVSAYLQSRRIKPSNSEQLEQAAQLWPTPSQAAKSASFLPNSALCTPCQTSIRNDTSQLILPKFLVAPDPVKNANPVQVPLQPVLPQGDSQCSFEISGNISHHQDLAHDQLSLVVRPTFGTAASEESRSGDFHFLLEQGGSQIPMSLTREDLGAFLNFAENHKIWDANPKAVTLSSSTSEVVLTELQFNSLLDFARKFANPISNRIAVTPNASQHMLAISAPEPRTFAPMEATWGAPAPVTPRSPAKQSSAVSTLQRQNTFSVQELMYLDELRRAQKPRPSTKRSDSSLLPTETEKCFRDPTGKSYQQSSLNAGLFSIKIPKMQMQTQASSAESTNNKTADKVEREEEALQHTQILQEPIPVQKPAQEKTLQSEAPDKPLPKAENNLSYYERLKCFWKETDEYDRCICERRAWNDKNQQQYSDEQYRNQVNPIDCTEKFKQAYPSN